MKENAFTIIIIIQAKSMKDIVLGHKIANNNSEVIREDKFLIR